MFPFTNLQFSFTSIADLDQQTHLSQAIQTLGGTLMNAMNSSTTHLIVPNTWRTMLNPPTPELLKTKVKPSSGLKLMAACKWQIKVVIASWVDACLHANTLVTHSFYFLNWLIQDPKLLRSVFDTHNSCRSPMTRLGTTSSLSLQTIESSYSDSFPNVPTDQYTTSELPNVPEPHSSTAFSTLDQVPLFHGLFFTAAGLPPDRCDNLRLLVIEHGGRFLCTVPTKDSMVQLVHVVVPVCCTMLDSIAENFTNSVNAPCQYKIVSDTWVHHCLLDQTVHNIDDDSWFLYIPHCPQNIPELNGIQVSTTGFSVPDTRALAQILTGLGATYTSEFTLNCQILLCNQAQGTKFQKAQTQNIPTVSITWLKSALSSKTFPSLDTYEFANKPQQIFTGSLLCFTAKVKSLGATLRQFVELYGAEVLLGFSRKCTHVIHLAQGVPAPLQASHYIGNGLSLKREPGVFSGDTIQGVGNVSSDREVRLALANGIHVVSPWWIVMSAKHKRRLSEHDFPPTFDPNRQLLLHTINSDVQPTPFANVGSTGYHQKMHSSISRPIKYTKKRARPSVISDPGSPKSQLQVTTRTETHANTTEVPEAHSQLDPLLLNQCDSLPAAQQLKSVEAHSLTINSSSVESDPALSVTNHTTISSRDEKEKRASYLRTQQQELMAVVETMLKDLGPQQQEELDIHPRPVSWKRHFDHSTARLPPPLPDPMWRLPEENQLFTQTKPIITYDDPIARKGKQKMLALINASASSSDLPTANKSGDQPVYPKVWVKAVPANNYSSSGSVESSSGAFMPNPAIASKTDLSTKSTNDLSASNLSLNFSNQNMAASHLEPPVPEHGPQLSNPQTNLSLNPLYQSKRPSSTTVKPAPKIALSGTLSKRTSFVSVINQLGGELMHDETVSSRWVPGTTHLVISVPITCEKCMCAIAAGAWLLRPSFIEASHSAQTWVDEIDHTWAKENDLNVRQSNVQEAGVSVDGFDLKRSMELIAGWHRWFKQIHPTPGGTCSVPLLNGAFDGWRVLLIDQPATSSYRMVLEAGGAILVHTWDPVADPNAVTHILKNQSHSNLPLLLHPIARARTHLTSFALHHLLGNRPSTPLIRRSTGIGL